MNKITYLLSVTSLSLLPLISHAAQLEADDFTALNSSDENYLIVSEVQGDYNGDGVLDIVAIEDDVSPEIDTKLYILYGGAGELSAGSFVAQADVVIDSYRISDDENESILKVLTAADVDNDGYTDLLLDNSSYHYDESNNPYTYHSLNLIYGSSNIASGSLDDVIDARWIYDSGAEEDGTQPVCRSATFGNFNGDSDLDLALSCFGPAHEEKIYLDYDVNGRWSGDMTVDDFDATINGQDSDYNSTRRFGLYDMISGNLTGSSLDDIIITANKYERTNAENGAVYIIDGANLPTSGELAVEDVYTTRIDGDLSVSAGVQNLKLGDINGDDKQDLVIGNESDVRLFYGGAKHELGQLHTKLSKADAIFSDLHNPLLSDYLSVNDLNGDGFGDVLFTVQESVFVSVGNDSYENAVDTAAVVFYGGSGAQNGLSGYFSTDEADITIQNSQNSNFFLSYAADVNDDQRLDLVGSSEHALLLQRFSTVDLPGNIIGLTKGRIKLDNRDNADQTLDVFDGNLAFKQTDVRAAGNYFVALNTRGQAMTLLDDQLKVLSTIKLSNRNLPHASLQVADLLHDGDLEAVVSTRDNANSRSLYVAQLSNSGLSLMSSTSFVNGNVKSIFTQLAEKKILMKNENKQTKKTYSVNNNYTLTAK